MKKFLSVLLFVVLTLSALPTTIFATANIDAPLENQSAWQEYAAATDAYGSLQMTNYKSHYLPTESIVPSFTVTHSVAIDSYSYINAGFSSVGITLDDTDETVLNVELSCSSAQSECSLQIDALLESGETVSSYVYAVNNDYGTFISPFSIDNARERYYKYALDENIITQEEIDIIWDERSKISGIVSYIGQYISENIGEIRGTIQWEDDNGDPHPLRKVKVEAYRDGLVDMKLATVYTDDDGYFSMQVWQGDNVYLKIYAGDSNVLVKSGIFKKPYYHVFNKNDQFINVTPGSIQEVEIDPIAMGSDWGKAFQISQAALTARDYAKEMMDETPSDVTVIYPHDGEIEEVSANEDMNGCYYQGALRTINITGQYGSDSRFPRSYSSWDEIMHEYGHHVQAELGFFDSPNGGHFVDEPSAEHFMWHHDNNIFLNCDRDCIIRQNFLSSLLIIPENQCKEKGCALAWAEAWASVFGNMAQEYYAEHLAGIDFVNDATYSSYRGFEYDYNSILYFDFHYDYRTEDIEVNIQALLYDFYDDDTSESFDDISFTHQEMWDYYTSSQAKTLYDFIEYLRNESSNSMKSSLGKLLNEYHLSSSAPTISSFSTHCPEVEFTWEEPNPGGYFNQRKYSVNFYNSSYNLTCSTEPQAVTLDSTGKGSIDISESLWQSVLDSSTTFYVSVTVGEYDGDLVNIGDNTFITKYESEYIRYSLSDLYETIYFNTSITKTLEVGDCYWFMFTAPFTGEYVFESTGTTDTYGELFSNLAAERSITNRLDYNDDGGDSNNFKINYTLTEGDVVFLRARGFSWTKTGDFTVKITCPNHTHDYTYSYSRYSSIMHKAYCGCGASKTERHTFQIGSVINYCKHCGYSVSADTPVVKDSVDDELDPYGEMYYIPEEE